jgi:hypothetical protein
VSYTATGDLRPSEAIDDMCRILASGANVVATSVVPLVFPPAADPSIVARIQAACDQGGTTCFTSGIDPGFANDTLPLVLTGLCERIEQVRVMEIVNYATYNQPQVLFETMGFAQPLDHQPILLIPGILSLAYGDAAPISKAYSKLMPEGVAAVIGAPAQVGPVAEHKLRLPVTGAPEREVAGEGRYPLAPEGLVLGVLPLRAQESAGGGQGEGIVEVGPGVGRLLASPGHRNSSSEPILGYAG